MVPPTSPRTLAEHSSSLLLQSARSKLLAEQSAKLLLETARIFPSNQSPTGVAPIFIAVSPGEKSSGSNETGHPGVKIENTDDGKRKSDPGRCKQKFPKWTRGFESKCTMCTCTRPELGRRAVGARVHRGIQCNLQTEFSSWQTEFCQALGSPRTQARTGGITLSKIAIGDPRNNLKGMSWKENERKRQSVIRKIIWAELQK